MFSNQYFGSEKGAAMAESSPSDEQLHDNAMLQRPAFHLDSLSVEMKWETTRRHPLYLWLWQTWNAVKNSFGAEAESEFINHPGPQWAWLMLDVNGIPADPALEFDALVHSVQNPLWLKRSARPVTYRTLAKILQAKLSADGLKILGTLLFDAGETALDSEEREQKLLQLNNLDWDELDRLVDLPILQFNPHAPSKEFVSDITNLRGDARNRLGLEESRTNESKMRDYLHAWDLREGWHHGEYDRSRPMTVVRIAQELNLTLRQAKYAYQQAFQMISGHAFNFDNWVRLLGLVQLSEYFGDQVSPASLHRLRHAATVRGVDDTTLSGGPDSGRNSVLEQIPDDDNDFDVSHAIDRIRELLDLGKTKNEILDDLDLGPDAEPCIERIRETMDLEGH